MKDQNQQLAKQQQDLFPWGVANPRRGRAYHELALKFIDTLPHGTQCGDDELKSFAQNNGESVNPEITVSALRAKLNTAGNMPEMGKKAFQIASIGAHRYEVRSPIEQIAKSELTQKVRSYIQNQKRHLQRNLQGTDISDLSEMQAYLLQTIYDGWDRLEQTLELTRSAVDRPMTKLLETVAISLPETTE
jgi:hypothetical protein